MLPGACLLLPPCSLATTATTSSISSKKKIHTSQIKDGFNTSEKLIHKSIRASQTKEKGSTHHKSAHPWIDSYITDRGAGFNTNKITHLQIDSHNIEEGPAQLLRRSGAGPLQLLSTPQM